MKNSKRAALPIAVGLLMGLGFTALFPVPPILCPEEDSPHCVWIGPLQGNGTGAIVINIDESHWITLGGQ